MLPGYIGQRVAQAGQAKLCRGQARPQNHNKRFPQYQATRAGTFEKIRCQLQTSWAEGGSGKPGQRCCWASWAAKSKQTVLGIHSDRVFSSEKVAFFKKYF
jgi:hypothetical protein